MTDGLGCSIVSFMQRRLSSTPPLLTHKFDFNGKVMEGFITCLKRMVPDQEAH
jgi:hypothetical protein